MIHYFRHDESDCVFATTISEHAKQAFQTTAVAITAREVQAFVAARYAKQKLVLVVIDFETYYDTATKFSLSSMTAEEYIRHDEFEIIMCGVRMGHERFWVTGTHSEIEEQLRALVPWEKAYCVAHNNSEFDSLILAERLNIYPKVWGCTLAMARALHGTTVGGSLKKLAKFYGLEDKGTEIENANGKRRKDFSLKQLEAYASYCVTDCDICHDLFAILRKQMPSTELQLVHLFTRMFAEPRIKLRHNALELYLTYVQNRVKGFLKATGLTSKQIRSDATFKNMLEQQGVKVGMKPSPKRKDAEGNPLMVPAFAKTDEFMAELLEDDDPFVALMAEARINVKSSIEESRLKRLVGISSRGLLPVPLRYGATHTHRVGGSGKINLNNAPRNKGINEKTPLGCYLVTPHGLARYEARHIGNELLRTDRGKTYRWYECHQLGIRDMLWAPEGKKLVVADSSNIELRTCHLGAGQLDTIDRIRQYEAQERETGKWAGDIYCDFATGFYGREINKSNFKERMHGKVAELQLQYQSGWESFQKAARTMGGVILTDLEAQQTVDLYRAQKSDVKKFWWHLQSIIPRMAAGERGDVDPAGLCHFDGNKIVKPSGIPLFFEDLHLHQFKDEDGKVVDESWVYTDKEKRHFKRIYGGQMTENFASSLARDVVFEQTLEVEKRWGNKRGNGVVLTVHDEIIVVVDEDDAEECLKFTIDVMEQAPKWWPDLPLKAEGDISSFYGGAK